MVLHPTPAPQGADRPARRYGVGIDTSRYGHYAVFLRDDLQPAPDELSFAESAVGYGLVRQRLERIAQRQGPVHFVVRLDAAAQYADNLFHFLHRLGASGGDTVSCARSPVDCKRSCVSGPA